MLPRLGAVGVSDDLAFVVDDVAGLDVISAADGGDATLGVGARKPRRRGGCRGGGGGLRGGLCRLGGAVVIVIAGSDAHLRLPESLLPAPRPRRVVERGR